MLENFLLTIDNKEDGNACQEVTSGVSPLKMVRVPNTRGRSRVYAEHWLGSQSLSSRRKPIEEFDNAARIWGRVAWARGLGSARDSLGRPGRREAVVRYDAAQGLWVPVPIDLNATGDQVYLVLYGTGIRLWHALADVAARVGSLDLPVSFAGAHPLFPGLDQINVALPRSLDAVEQVNVSLNVASTTSNVVTVTIR